MTVMTTTDKLETRPDTRRDRPNIGAAGEPATIRAGIRQTGIPERKRRSANTAETYVREVNQ